LSNNRYATLALVFGIISLFFQILAIPAIILGIVGLVKSRTPPHATIGRTLSLVGLGMGIVSLVIGIVQIGWFLSFFRWEF
jgi:hypothetical protein